MKLKILDDMKEEIDYEDRLLLKQEAIKWVKFLRTKPKAITYDNEEIEHDFKESIAWICEFFNITETELENA